MRQSKPVLLQAAVTLTVPFHDVDPAGLVWHGNYFRYFEAARCAALDKIDYSYRQMADSGVVWPVADLQSRFSAPVRFHDVINVEARMTEWEYRMVFEYSLTQADGALAASGKTIQVPVDMNDGELLIGAPSVLAERMQAHLELQGQNG
ncbi:MAG: acyl-CoA thioesterase [Pseudomonadota bacterium]